MLTLKMLKDMPEGTIFAQGETTDDENGLNMTHSGKKLRWVAVRGDIHDWAIYCHWADRDWEWIRWHGDKVHSKDNIKRMVEADEEAMKMYRD